MADAARYLPQLPYMEQGSGRDSKEVCTATVRSAVAAAPTPRPSFPAGGHSFSGRMTSHAAANPRSTASAASSFASSASAGEPGTKRADHPAGHCPDALLSGTRDELAHMDLLQPVCKKLGRRATLHLLDTADHGFRILKRSRKSEEDVFVEMARTVREWASRLK
jgi:predicted alpha/beta-hydrolase family hydrolase